MMMISMQNFRPLLSFSISLQTGIAAISLNAAKVLASMGTRDYYSSQGIKVCIAMMGNLLNLSVSCRMILK